MICRTYRFGTACPGKPVSVEIFAPREEETGDFSCRLRIDGLKEKPFDTRIFGIDSLQATMLALQLAGTELYGAGDHPGPHVFLYAPNDNLDIPTTTTVLDHVKRRDPRGG
ncbi:hypothetical protein [Maricaulis sp.]|uniref:DUF6968 family protein n=1 Tax=Maricaulis sp. TaxID=1486257 RepID=UPI001B098125|nr:hypothetical protein [Maricaulis sp.]MBO6766526.1 hypothetical protein [Maricaulis sp.]